MAPGTHGRQVHETGDGRVKFEPRLPRDDVNVTPRHPLKEGVVLVVGVSS